MPLCRIINLIEIHENNKRSFMKKETGRQPSEAPTVVSRKKKCHSRFLTVNYEFLMLETF